MEEHVPKVADTPVRIICRFANGLLQSSVARGVSLKKNVLQVTSREHMEVGISVTVMGAFLDRTNPAQVTSVKRGAEPGSYVIELTLRTMAAPIAAPKTGEISEGSSRALREAAQTLANRLDAAGWVPYHRAAFEKAAPSDRALYLAATEIAVCSLLADRGLADVSVLRATLSSAAGKAGAQNR